MTAPEIFELQISEKRHLFKKRKQHRFTTPLPSVQSHLSEYNIIILLISDSLHPPEPLSQPAVTAEEWSWLVEAVDDFICFL